MSLGVGAYRTSEGKPWILPVVKKAEKILAEKVSIKSESKQGRLDMWVRSDKLARYTRCVLINAQFVLSCITFIRLL